MLLLTGCQPADDSWVYEHKRIFGTPYGDEPGQTVDLYLQGTWTGEPTYFEPSVEPRPTLVYIHGGGWMVRDRGPESWLLPFVERGWNVVAVTYRVGPGTAPAAVDDAICALDWVIGNAGELSVDTEHVVLMGESAGGHLSLSAGILASRPGHDCYPGDSFRVRGVINWFGITDIEANSDWLDANPPPYGNYAANWIGNADMADFSSAYSPVHMAHEDMPPVLTIHGTDDAIVPFAQAETLHERLADLGVDNRLLPLPGGRHAGFTPAQFEQAFAAMLEFAGAD